MKEQERKVELRVRVDEDLMMSLIRLGIRPSQIASKAFRDEVKRVERQLELKALQEMDPRMTMADLSSRSARTRRLRGL